jgi:hypothetical protein
VHCAGPAHSAARALGSVQVRAGPLVPGEVVRHTELPPGLEVASRGEAVSYTELPPGLEAAPSGEVVRYRDLPPGMKAASWGEAGRYTAFATEPKAAQPDEEFPSYERPQAAWRRVRVPARGLQSRWENRGAGPFQPLRVREPHRWRPA